MASWSTFRTDAPDLAAKVRARLEAHRHHVMATLRADGAPRVSGTEVTFWNDDLVIGSMWQARKALDLLRDPRIAIHSNPSDEKLDGGDARIDAVAEEVVGEANDELFAGEEAPPGPNHLFRLDLRRVSLVEVDEARDLLIVTTWNEGRGVTRVERT
jgi:hypothetical protein